MEVVKLLQVYFISNDLELYYAEIDQPVLCRALNINEDLGQIKYVFSDKTGTLTENKMVFKRCTIGGRNFAHKDKLGKNYQVCDQLSNVQSCRVAVCNFSCAVTGRMGRGARSLSRFK